MQPELLTDANYQDFLQNHALVVVDYYADWCGPCQMMHPIYEELAGQISTARSEVSFAKINIDESPDAADAAGVMSVPSFVIYKNGEEVDRHIGGASAEDLEKFIETNY